jgi:hypothetical protein
MASFTSTQVLKDAHSKLFENDWIIKKCVLASTFQRIGEKSQNTLQLISVNCSYFCPCRYYER